MEHGKLTTEYTAHLQVQVTLTLHLRLRPCVRHAWTLVRCIELGMYDEHERCMQS